MRKQRKKVARNNLQVVPPDGSTITILASGACSVDFDLNAITNAQFMIEQTYSATHATTTGLSVKLYAGFGGTYPGSPVGFVVGGVPVTVAYFSDNSDIVTMSTVTTGSATTTTYRTAFYLNDVNTRWPRWLRITMTNTDPTNTAQVRIKADL